MRGGPLLALVWLVAGVPAALAQEPVIQPTPEPARLGQDEIDLRGRSSIVLGSGARAYGMGGAFLARADDATAASWNPAGLSYLRVPEVSVVGARSSALTVETQTSGRTKTDTGFASHTPDFAAITYPMALGSSSGAVQASFQRVVSFKAKRTLVETGTDDVARIQSGGGFDVLALGAGFRLPFRLRLGVTYNHWFNGYSQSLERDRPRATANPTKSAQSATLAMSAWNVNAGLIWTPFESLNIGIVGKTPFTAEATLDRQRTDTFPATQNRPSETTENTYRQPYTVVRDGIPFRLRGVEIDFPGAFGAGLSWRPRNQLTLSVDFTRTFWTNSVIRNFVTLPPRRPEQSPPVLPQEGQDYFRSSPYPTLDDVDQNDSQQLRAGAEYVIIRDRFKAFVRGGYFLDRQIFRDLDGVSPTFGGYTFGLGLLVGPILLDGAFIEQEGDFVDAARFSQSVRTRRVLASLIYRHGGSR